MVVLWTKQPFARACELCVVALASASLSFADSFGSPRAETLVLRLGSGAGWSILDWFSPAPGSSSFVSPLQTFAAASADVRRASPSLNKTSGNHALEQRSPEKHVSNLFFRQRLGADPANSNEGPSEPHRTPS